MTAVRRLAVVRGTTMDEQHERYVEMPTTVLRGRGLSFGAIVLYGILRDYAGQKKVCWPAIDTLAGDLDAHRNTVHAYLDELQTAGLIVIHRHGKGKNNSYSMLDIPSIPVNHAQPTVHETEEHAQPEVHDSDLHAQPTVHGHAQPTVHTLKEEPTPVEQTPSTTSHEVVDGRAAHSDPPEQSAESRAESRAEQLCTTLGLAASPATVAGMVAVVNRLGAECESVCGVSLEEKAIDARFWLDGPKNKHHQRPSVQFFRDTWVRRDIKNAMVPHTSNGHRAPPPVPDTVLSEREAILAARRAKHLEKNGDLIGFE